MTQRLEILYFKKEILLQIFFGLSGSICSIHSSSKNLECSAEPFATVEKQYIACGQQTPKSSNGHENPRYLVEKS